MKSKLVTLLTVTVVAIAASSAFATIKNTKHDLSTGTSGNLNGTGVTGGTDQVCKYCHTPHNAVQDIPLWNRDNPTNTNGTFKFYSSPTMSLHRAAATNGSFESTSISLFCMSCHDGGSIGAKIHNSPAPLTGVSYAGTATKPAIDGTADTIVAAAKGNLGTDLRNDHPVNLMLNTALQNQIYANDGKTINGTGLTKGLPLFKGTAGNGYIECGSCHAVHDNTAKPFLRTTNAGSKLCLACHIK